MAIKKIYIICFLFAALFVNAQIVNKTNIVSTNTVLLNVTKSEKNLHYK